MQFAKKSIGVVLLAVFYATLSLVIYQILRVAL